MENRNSLKTVLLLMWGMLIVVITMAALLPFLNQLVKVEVQQTEAPVVTQAPAPGKPQDCMVTAIYEMAENSKKITAIYIEVFHAGSSTVSYVRVPVDAKVTLSEELYKSLQTYAPELPQYMKLSNMAESFSKEYGLTGCNRILSEVLGITLEEYVRADADTLATWFDLQIQEKTATGFFADYTEWLEQSVSSMGTEERWMYYENWQQVNWTTMETAPGSQEKDGYLISGKRSKELLQELMIKPVE